MAGVDIPRHEDVRVPAHHVQERPRDPGLAHGLRQARVHDARAEHGVGHAVGPARRPAVQQTRAVLEQGQHAVLQSGHLQVSSWQVVKSLAFVAEHGCVQMECALHITEIER